MEQDKRHSWRAARDSADAVIERKYLMATAKIVARVIRAHDLGEAEAARAVDGVWVECHTTGNSASFMQQLRLEGLIPENMFISRTAGALGHQLLTATEMVEGLYAHHVRPYVPAGVLVFPTFLGKKLDKNWALHTLYEADPGEGVTVTHRTDRGTYLLQPLCGYLRTHHGA
jgi:hypothetical protein